MRQNPHDVARSFTLGILNKVNRISRRLVMLGVAVGLLAAFGLTRLMACYLPARRASSLDPMSAPRYE